MHDFFLKFPKYEIYGNKIIKITKTSQIYNYVSRKASQIISSAIAPTTFWIFQYWNDKNILNKQNIAKQIVMRLFYEKSFLKFLKGLKVCNIF